MRFKFLLAAALVAGTASTAAAQFSITPFVGSMIPMRSLLLDTAGQAAFRMENQAIYGLTLSKAMSPRLGLALALGAGTGKLEIVGTQILTIHTSLWFADLRARLRVAGNDDADLGVVGGLGWTQFSSGLFDAAHVASDSTKLKGTVTGVLGLGLRAKLGDHLTLAVSALDRIHEESIEAPGITAGFKDPIQHDMMFTAGLAFPLGH